MDPGSPSVGQQRRSPGLVTYVAAVAYHFCLALPAAFTQPGDQLLARPCIFGVHGLFFARPTRRGTSAIKLDAVVREWNRRAARDTSEGVNCTAVLHECLLLFCSTKDQRAAEAQLIKKGCNSRNLKQRCDTFKLQGSRNHCGKFDGQELHVGPAAF